MNAEDLPDKVTKSADIPDELFILAVRATAPMSAAVWPWRFRDDVQRSLETMLGFKVPERLFLAKARKLGERGLLEGCTRCTCRGDYHLPAECEQRHCC